MGDEKLKQFITQRKYLVWWVKDPRKLGPKSIVEATLNYGNWKDVQELIRIMGINEVAWIFRENSKLSAVGRQNYDKATKNYFNLYFNKYASSRK
ncbi:MAG: hypothetical protein U9P61_02730 [Patescibacteria group bacterium]|nr:hypothetical protein [Patescibacteria group bacterium]